MQVGTELSVIGREEEAYYTRRVTEERKKAMVSGTQAAAVTNQCLVSRCARRTFTVSLLASRLALQSLARTCIKLQRWYRNKKKARLDKEAAEAAEAKKKKKATAKGDKKKK